MRRHYIDNIRWSAVVLVIIYHAVYLFNSAGVISSIAVKGIPQMDSLLYFVYPWFMILLFAAAGMSARYSLERRTAREFMKERTRKLLVPSIAGIFILGWISGFITSEYTDMFGGNGDMIPGFIKYIIFCLMGIGPLWFAHELFLASAVLLLIRKLDKKGRLLELGSKANIIALLLLAFAVWGSSNILNPPLIEVYRNGIYIFTFLVGYYVLSHENVTDCLAKYRIPLLIASVLCGIAYTVYYFGENYASRECLGGIFTNMYAWIAVLAIIGCFKAWCDKTNRFTQYMTQRSFGFYVLHYPLMTVIAYLVTTYLPIPMLGDYFVILAIEAVMLPLLYELIYRIPVLRFLLLGYTRKKI